LPLEITIDGQNGLVLIRMWGPWQLEATIEARQEISRICRERGIHRILADLHEAEVPQLPGRGTATRLGNVFRGTLDDQEPLDAVIAVILPTSAKARVVARFAMRAIVDRGIEIQGFSTTDTAMKWLFSPAAWRQRLGRLSY